ncbi:MAG: class I SAM-dependent methyltransferase [Verrucomicrobia bacterium]|nr:class I SAM-dependent methyltransferase [Verrucomicrobiota bacterium]
MVYKTETCCRACGSSNLTELIAFGDTPLADRLLTEEELVQEEHLVPLTLAICGDCSLVQILETVDPKVLFYSEYPYFSSISPSLQEHFRLSAEHLMQTRALGSDSLVVEAASNDGYLLRHFHQRGIPVLGIDPAEGPVKKALEIGVRTVNTFFTEDYAKELVESGKRADVFLANNVLAHVPGLNGFVKGISVLLKEDGVAVIEMPYVVDLIDHCEFDTIYHQHLCYFSVTALRSLFQSHGLHLNRIKRTSIHGGSLRIFVEKEDELDDSVLDLLQMEKERLVDRPDYFLKFADRVSQLKEELRKILSGLKAEGKTIAGYGAAAKACTLMAYCEIDKDDLDFVSDLNPYKHNKYMGGNRLPICPAEAVLEKQPDYLLILAWNFAEEIIKQMAPFAKQGGKFIVPVPFPRIRS